jgi:hypothetical protein
MGVKILFFIGVLCLACANILTIDKVIFSSRLYTYLFFKHEPNYQLPDGYKLVYSQSEKAYAIKVGDEYLWEGRAETETMCLSISNPTLCFDSGTAKGYAHAYILSHQPKVSDFK